MSIQKKLLDDLERRRTTLRQGGGERRHADRRAKGMLSARERLDIFFDRDTFQEWGMHVEHSCHDFGMEKKSMPCDGIVRARLMLRTPPTRPLVPRLGRFVRSVDSPGICSSCTSSALTTM